MWIMYDSRKGVGSLVFYGLNGWNEDPDACGPWPNKPSDSWASLLVITLDEARALYTLRNL